jgi:hypothetical protein
VTKFRDTESFVCDFSSDKAAKKQITADFKQRFTYNNRIRLQEFNIATGFVDFCIKGFTRRICGTFFILPSSPVKLFCCGQSTPVTLSV